MTAEKKWQKILRLLVAFGFGLAIAVYAYVRVSDPEPSMQRAREEKVVTDARAALKDNLKLPDDLQVVDPLAPEWNTIETSERLRAQLQTNQTRQ